MLISCDGEPLFTIEPEYKLLLADEIVDVEADIKRRLKWVIEHKLAIKFREFQNEWLEKLREDPSIVSIPADPKEFIKFVVARQDYKNRAQKDAELS